MIRQPIIACVFASLVGGLSLVQPASAEVIGECTLTGYTFMGGGSAYTSERDYFLGQPLGRDFWGFGWIKFDVGNSAVDRAYLAYDLQGVGSMSVKPATPDQPGYLDLYNPGLNDVANLKPADNEAGVLARTALRDYLLTEQPLHSVAMTRNGVHYVDITDLYNGWAIGSIKNHGLVFSAPVDPSGPGKYSGFGSGAAPYISTVPEPSAAVLLGTGMIGLGIARRIRLRTTGRTGV
ncbi:MAG: PEP-CTERM sorting domain-containing protein [Planctomycetaceae bacterium]|nr:PEP-CTERM sorting domain-containing protein [Planctomycetaceae bacterium]